MNENGPWDCLVIGGGPAGLTAALYLARYRRRVLVIDAGASRAAMIPKTHNFPGFPGGISGESLLARLRTQTAGYGAQFQQGLAEALDASPEGFSVAVGDQRIAAKRVILTTGVQDKGTEIPDVRGATHNGSIRWCPVCDGYEVIDQRVALVTPVASCLSHALFLRTFTRNLTCFAPRDQGDCDAPTLAQLADNDIELISTPIRGIAPTPDGVRVDLTTGEDRHFDTLYPLLGHEPRCQLATPLGAECDEIGDLIVDDHQQTSIPGLYAAGDLVRALNQMAVGMAHAATAATAVHNALPRNPR